MTWRDGMSTAGQGTFLCWRILIAVDCSIASDRHIAASSARPQCHWLLLEPLRHDDGRPIDPLLGIHPWLYVGRASWLSVVVVVYKQAPSSGQTDTIDGGRYAWVSPRSTCVAWCSAHARWFAWWRISSIGLHWWWCRSNTIRLHYKHSYPVTCLYIRPVARSTRIKVSSVGGVVGRQLLHLNSVRFCAGAAAAVSTATRLIVTNRNSPRPTNNALKLEDADWGSARIDLFGSQNLKQRSLNPCHNISLRLFYSLLCFEYTCFHFAQTVRECQI